jgi:hypothetical protein
MPTATPHREAVTCEVQRFSVQPVGKKLAITIRLHAHVTFNFLVSRAIAVKLASALHEALTPKEG